MRHKQKFNLIAFNSRVSAWRAELCAVSAETLRVAQAWVRALRCEGTTNTLAALRLALTDPNTRAVYLLTDGRPDQVQDLVL